MRFAVMIYYSLINLGLGEMSPVNQPEQLFCVLSMICSSFIFSHIFGEIGGLFHQMNQLQMEQQEKQDTMNDLMNAFEFRDNVKMEVLQYVNKIQPSREF